MTVYQRHGEGACSSAISQVTDALPVCSRYYCVLHATCCTWWCCSRTLVQTSKNPLPFKPWCLCCHLWAFSLVVRLGKYRHAGLQGAAQQGFYIHKLILYLTAPTKVYWDHWHKALFKFNVYNVCDFLLYYNSSFSFNFFFCIKILIIREKSENRTSF